MQRRDSAAELFLPLQTNNDDDTYCDNENDAEVTSQAQCWQKHTSASWFYVPAVWLFVAMMMILRIIIIITMNNDDDNYKVNAIN